MRDPAHAGRILCALALLAAPTAALPQSDGAIPGVKLADIPDPDTPGLTAPESHEAEKFEEAMGHIQQTDPVLHQEIQDRLNDGSLRIRRFNGANPVEGGAAVNGASDKDTIGLDLDVFLSQEIAATIRHEFAHVKASICCPPGTAYEGETFEPTDYRDCDGQVNAWGFCEHSFVHAGDYNWLCQLYEFYEQTQEPILRDCRWFWAKQHTICKYRLLCDYYVDGELDVDGDGEPDLFADQGHLATEPGVNLFAYAIDQCVQDMNLDPQAYEVEAICETCGPYEAQGEGPLEGPDVPDPGDD